jgi:anti-sigma regulatory factor (Ser/Thr protein kinase)
MFRRRTWSFKLKTPDEVRDISYALSRSFPTPEKFRLGIYELLVNAIEHGNLGLGFETKTALLRDGGWEEEIERRLALPDYRDRKVDIAFARTNRYCRLSIADQGKGFFWRKHLDRISCGRRPNGRGLLIAFNSGFDGIAFNRLGNRVTCVARNSEP